MIPKQLTPRTLKAWKESLGLSYKELAYLSPMSAGTWAEWCTGRSNIPAAARVMMADIEEKLEIPDE